MIAQLKEKCIFQEKYSDHVSDLNYYTIPVFWKNRFCNQPQHRLFIYPTFHTARPLPTDRAINLIG